MNPHVILELRGSQARHITRRTFDDLSLRQIEAVNTKHVVLVSASVGKPALALIAEVVMTCGLDGVCF